MTAPMCPCGHPESSHDPGGDKKRCRRPGCTCADYWGRTLPEPVQDPNLYRRRHQPLEHWMLLEARSIDLEKRVNEASLGGWTLGHLAFGNSLWLAVLTRPAKEEG
jgi:hypothetical protein